MKAAGYIVLVLFAAALESALPRALWLAAARPLVVVVLVVHFARELDTLEGLAFALFAGFVEDATAGYPTGLATFACVTLFLVARLAQGGLSSEGRVVETVFSAAAALVWIALVSATRRLFGPATTSFETLPWLSGALWSALATAVASPFVLWAARRVARLDRRAA